MLKHFQTLLGLLCISFMILGCSLFRDENEVPTTEIPVVQDTSQPAVQQESPQPATLAPQAPTQAPPAAIPWARGPKPDQAPVFLKAFGQKGIDIGLLSDPTAIAIDAQGNFYVGDNKALQKYDSDGNHLLSFGPDGYAGITTGIAVASDGKVYRSDPRAAIIEIYAPDGEKIGVLGEPGSGEGQFKQPFGLHFDDQGNLYVVDRGNFRVQKFDVAGNFIMAFGTRGDRNGEFVNPRNVAVDADGNIYVTDQASYLIQKFSPEGEFLLRIGQSHADESMWLVRGVTIDDENNIYIADGRYARIQKFDTEGTFLLEFGLPGREQGNLLDPDGIVIQDDRLYVVEKGNDRVQVFQTQ